MKTETFLKITEVFFAEPDQKTFDRCFPIAICDQNIQSDVVLFSFNNSTRQFWWKNWDLSRNHFFSVFEHTFLSVDICILHARKKISAINYSYSEITQTCFSSDRSKLLWSSEMFTTLLQQDILRKLFWKASKHHTFAPQGTKKLLCDVNSIIH